MLGQTALTCSHATPRDIIDVFAENTKCLYLARHANFAPIAELRRAYTACITASWSLSHDRCSPARCC
ncbi:hypothetical protein EVAR_67078_1 [Eumeta japonica]|uniref:Uncharacterized protein n=1 Tax=Eumeta variegata TaxID=151549 RepID=A0A4C2A8S4_EUMVA|nr:hypothetical protein EVAR_67078_1 [Eumeta japonica]